MYWNLLLIKIDVMAINVKLVVPASAIVLFCGIAMHAEEVRSILWPKVTVA